jgi:L-asparagine transporter-like permease
VGVIALGTTVALGSGVTLARETDAEVGINVGESAGTFIVLRAAFSALRAVVPQATSRTLASRKKMLRKMVPEGLIL